MKQEPLLLNQSALKVAPKLIGMKLVRTIGRKKIVAKIIETEAYCGEKDLASHASKGRTKRTEVMYDEAGTIYVYLCYGIHYLLNIVTSEKENPEAVLIRGVEVDGKKYLGPGRVTRVLEIDKILNTKILGKKGTGLSLEPGNSKKKLKIEVSKRVGVDYAGDWANRLWRFTLGDDN